MPDLQLWIDDQVREKFEIILDARAEPHQGTHLISAHDEDEVTQIAIAAGLDYMYRPPGFEPHHKHVHDSMTAAHVPNAEKMIPPTLFHYRSMHGKEVIHLVNGIYSADELANMGPGIVAHFDATLQNWVPGP